MRRKFDHYNDILTENTRLKELVIAGGRPKPTPLPPFPSITFEDIPTIVNGIGNVEDGPFAMSFCQEKLIHAFDACGNVPPTYVTLNDARKDMNQNDLKHLTKYGYIPSQSASPNTSTIAQHNDTLSTELVKSASDIYQQHIINMKAVEDLGYNTTSNTVQALVEGGLNSGNIFVTIGTKSLSHPEIAEAAAQIRKTKNEELASKNEKHEADDMKAINEARDLNELGTNFSEIMSSRLF